MLIGAGQSLGPAWIALGGVVLTAALGFWQWRKSQAATRELEELKHQRAPENDGAGIGVGRGVLGSVEKPEIRPLDRGERRNQP